MTKRFKNAYDALVKAFFDGILLKGEFCACAVGNLVAHGQHLEVTNDLVEFDKFKGEAPNSYWKRMFYTGGCGTYNIESYPNLAEQILDETGYTAYELSIVESSFEKSTEITYGMLKNKTETQITTDQFNGLMAVMQVLMELDGITDTSYKEVFAQHPQLELDTVQI